MARGIRKDQDRVVLDQLISANFKASDEQIETLARLNLHNIQGLDNVRGAYLKSLVAGVQTTAKPASRKRPAEVATALDTVHDRFYAAVTRGVVTPDIFDDDGLEQEEKTRRSLERNRRTTFARTAKNAVANYIKAGGDVFALDPVTVTKNELNTFVLAMRAKSAAPNLEHRATLAVDRLEEIARELADDDKDAAVQAVQEVMARMANFLTELGLESTTKTLVAVRDHKLLRLPEGSFWPMGKATAPRPSMQ